MQFGERVKTLRKTNGLKQQEVADRLGISLRAYAAYETKNVRPRKMETYEKLADIFKCNVNELLVEDNSVLSPILQNTAQYFMELNAYMAKAILGMAAIAVPATIKRLNSKDKDNADETWEKEQNRLATQYEKKMKKFSITAIGIILTELGKKGLKCQVGEVKDLAEKGSLPDDYIKVDGANIDEWWFVYWNKENRENEQYVITDGARTYLLFNRFGPTIPDPRRKASVVVDDEKMFDAICELKGKNSYRGNLSVILIDTEDSSIVKEELLSSYDIDDTEDKLPAL